MDVEKKEETESVPQWYALYTRSHCEQLVYDQLFARGLRLFLPKMEVFSKRAGKSHFVPVPLFASYLFVHCVMDKPTYLTIKPARGLVRIVGGRWNNLAIIPEEEIRAIQRVVQSQIPFRLHPYLQKGDRVRIIKGPLEGVEGIFLEVRRLILSVGLLQRSVAVEVDMAWVERL